MALKLSNNAISRLAGNITNTDTSIALEPGTGALFPSIGAGDWFPVTIVNATNDVEVVLCTARSGDVLTVTRAQENTSARAFNAGDRIELRMTAGAFEGIFSIIDSKLPLTGGTVSGNLAVTGSLTAGGHGVWTAGNFNPASYMPVAGGMFTGTVGVQSTAPQINFNDVDWGWRYLHCNGGNIGFLNNGGGWACYSQNDGTFIATANIGAYSDRKHKTDIRTIESALDLVECLRGVRYTRKADGTDRIGVIAQEVEEVLPQVVGESPDGLYVDYGCLVAPLIEAVKELSAKVRKLEEV
jgi:hypothetical protein